MIRKASLLALWCLLNPVSRAFADQVSVSTFKGLNSNESSVIIDPAYAQDELNVTATPGGKSVKKGDGYGVYKTLYSSNLQGVHGGYHFFDSSGNDVQVWGSSNSLYGIVADAAPTQLVSSATLNATWDCADTQGSGYCVNSSRDALIKTNGATMTWFSSVLGTMVETTPDRLVVAGVAGNANTLYVSGSNSFTTFTTGLLSTDPFNEVIAAPGSKLTHIRWGCGKLLWWKDQSFGYFAFDDQYSASVKTISDTIGTFDNTSAIDPGGSVWFRGQDGHTWQYDCSGLLKQTIEITPQVQASGRRVSTSWLQSTQTDFQSGGIVPTGQLSTSISPGDVVSASYTVTENSSASGWGSGTSTNFAVGTSSISLKTNDTGTVNAPGFEGGSGGNFTADWTNNGFGDDGSTPVPGCTLTPNSGSLFALAGGTGSSPAVAIQVLDINLNLLGYDSYTSPNSCNSWIQKTLLSDPTVIGKRVYYRFQYSDSGVTKTLTTASTYIYGGIVKYFVQGFTGSGITTIGLDDITFGSSTITTGSFTSQVFNTGLTSATYQLQVSFTANTSTPSFALQTSTANPTNNWVNTLTSSGTSAVGNKYARYISTISVTGIDNALTAITGVTVLARSSGTFYSAVKNDSALTSWSTFNPTFQNNDGSHAFFIRSSSNSFTVLSSTPAWTAQTANSQVIVTTYTWFQVRDDFSLTAATNTPTLNDFSVNWFDGNASDQAYMLYFDNAIWESVSYGTGVSSNTYIFRRDLINDGWFLYNFGAGGMLVQNNHLFFGDVGSTAQVFQYGSGTSYNGSAINAYWKSKSFTGSDPFNRNQYTNIDTLAKQNSSQSFTATYALDTSTTTTSFTINLSSTTQSIINNRKNLPNGKNGYLFNIQYGDNTTTSSWELLGYRFMFMPQPYTPSQ